MEMNNLDLILVDFTLKFIQVSRVSLVMFQITRFSRSCGLYPKPGSQTGTSPAWFFFQPSHHWRCGRACRMRQLQASPCKWSWHYCFAKNRHCQAGPCHRRTLLLSRRLSRRKAWKRHFLAFLSTLVKHLLRARKFSWPWPHECWSRYLYQPSVHMYSSGNDRKWSLDCSECRLTPSMPSSHRSTRRGRSWDQPMRDSRLLDGA